MCSSFAVRSSYALSDLWFCVYPCRWIGSWSYDASVWRFSAERERFASLAVVSRGTEAYLDPSASVLREVEACTDPPSPPSVSGKGSLYCLRLRRLLFTEGGSSQSSALPFKNPRSFGLKLPIFFFYFLFFFGFYIGGVPFKMVFGSRRLVSQLTMKLSGFGDEGQRKKSCGYRFACPVFDGVQSRRYRWKPLAWRHGGEDQFGLRFSESVESSIGSRLLSVAEAKRKREKMV